MRSYTILLFQQYFSVDAYYTIWGKKIMVLPMSLFIALIM